ncbi:PaaI family thioesterase [uncultured Microbacterium sp.]|uniref:PaaI family thioesterase n=1 Tax=uncultured Microbacterium sp. TaxID=191216 RepID=UPI0025DD19DB|nr:PaaI family thioesterase [uncultured Microbacterium sp.]
MTPWTIVPGALDERLGIVVTAQAADRVSASMPVDGNTQSLGRLHGGATAALAEAVGSWAAMIHASTLGKVCVGVDLNITHHRGARAGRIHAVATAAHRGRRVATYDVRVVDDEDRLVATARITNLIVDGE